MRNNNIIISSMKCFHIGSKAWSSSFLVFVLMLLVSFFLFAVDFSSFFSSSSSVIFGVGGGGGGENSEKHEFVNGGGGEDHRVNVSSFRDGDTLLLGLPPSISPSTSPLPDPGNISAEGSRSKEVISLTQGARRTDLKLERLELGLARARAAIREGLSNQSQKIDLVDSDYMPQGPVYRNALAFSQYEFELP